MRRFVDELVLDVASGSGGSGCVSFRREKYVPKGGPDGGDGGRGGDVIFVVRRNLKTLAHLRRRRIQKAKNGAPGEGRQRHGRDGDSVIIPVPPGTLIRDEETGELIRDFPREGEEWVFLRGGQGGKGNTHFKSSRVQAPRFAQPGKPGETARLRVELNIIADIGFVGFPNAGKSSLLGALSRARPEVAAYPFTTRVPHLGVLRRGDQDLVLADIPGIIEGASQGAGLGFKFLKHISRTAILAFLVDLSDPNWEGAFPVLLDELEQYAPELVKKPRILVATKLDLEEAAANFTRFGELFPDEALVGISVFSGTGLEDLQRAFFAAVRTSASKPEDPA